MLIPLVAAGAGPPRGSLVARKSLLMSKVDPKPKHCEKLTKAAAHARSQLRGWAAIDPNDWNSVLRGNFELGGAERIANLLSLASVDEDGDGDVSEEEYQANENKLEGIVNNTSTLFLNSSVVAALIISIVYAIPLSGIDVSDVSSAYFANHWINVIEWAFLSFTGLTIALAILILYGSLRLYLILNFWMYSLECKIWFVQTVSVSVVPIIIAYQLCIGVSGFALISGTFLFISPGKGLVIGIMTLVCVCAMLTVDKMYGKSMILKLHEEAQRLHTNTKVPHDGPGDLNPRRQKLLAMNRALSEIDPEFRMKYVSALVGQGVDLALLPKLTREDFRTIGIPVGPAILIMEASQATPSHSGELDSPSLPKTETAL